MAARALQIALFALCVSTVAIQLPSVLAPSAATTPATSAAEASPPLDDAVPLQILLPLIVMEALFVVAVPFVYRHGHHRAAVAAGAGNRRFLESSELLAFALCVVVGLLDHFLLAHQPAGGGAPADGGAQAQARRALGLVALRVLPSSAAATFFLGLALVYAHVVVAGSDDGPVPQPAVRILAEMTIEAAAALVGIMAMVVVCSAAPRNKSHRTG